MKKLIRKIKSLPFQFQQKFNSIYIKQTQYAIQSPSIKTQKQLTYHPNAYPELDKFFLRFANSRPIQGRVSGKSLAFVIGAQHIGKTEYINKNLSQLNKKIQSARSLHFSQSKNIQLKNSKVQFTALKSPEYFENEIMQSQFESPYLLLVKKDYKKGGDLNFINFVEDLHDQLFKEIVRIMTDFEKDNQARFNNKVLGKNKQKQQHNIQQNILTSEIIKNIVISYHSPEYVYIHLKDVVFAILEQKDPIRLSKEGLNLLEQFNSEYLEAGRCQVENFFIQHFEELIQIIHQHKQNHLFIQHSKSLKSNQNISKSITTLEFFYSICQRMEYEHRPAEFQYSSYKSGIETTDFLFEVTNFLTGIGKYVENLQKQYKSLEQSEREEWKQKLIMKNNFILNGNHIDSLLCLANIEHLLCFKTRQPAFLNWIDHIILRTVQSTGFRHHFPLMIQIPNRKFLDQLFQLGKIQGSNPVIIQIPGYLQSFLKYTNLIQIFDEKRAIKLFHSFGRNSHTWKNAIENMAMGVDIQEIFSGEADYQKKEKIIAQAKLNRVYTDEGCLGLMNKGMLDFDVMEVLRLFGKINGMGRAQFSFVGTVLYKQPYFQAMLQKNIFYHGYYIPYMDYSNNLPAYLSIFSSIHKQLSKNNSYLGFLYWKHFIKEYKLSKLDLRYKHVHQKLFIEAQNWGREHIDLQFVTTYYGPFNDYGIVYQAYNKPRSLMD